MFWFYVLKYSKSTFQQRKNGSRNSQNHVSSSGASVSSPLYLFPVLPHHPTPSTSLSCLRSFFHLPCWLPSSDFPAFILKDSESLYSMRIWGISEHPALGLVFIFSSCCVYRAMLKRPACPTSRMTYTWITSVTKEIPIWLASYLVIYLYHLTPKEKPSKSNTAPIINNKRFLCGQVLDTLRWSFFS